MDSVNDEDFARAIAESLGVAQAGGDPNAGSSTDVRVPATTCQQASSSTGPASSPPALPANIPNLDAIYEPSYGMTGEFVRCKQNLPRRIFLCASNFD